MIRYFVPTVTKPIQFVEMDALFWQSLKKASIYYYWQPYTLLGWRLNARINGQWLNLEKHITQCYRKDKNIIHVNGNVFDCRHINLLVIDQTSYSRWVNRGRIFNKTLDWWIEGDDKLVSNVSF